MSHYRIICENWSVTSSFVSNGSVAPLEELGFERTGRYPEWKYHGGGFHDDLVYAITSDGRAEPQGAPHQSDPLATPSGSVSTSASGFVPASTYASLISHSPSPSRTMYSP